MGKKKTATGLGRTLIKSRFGQNKTDGDSFLHTSELKDGYDWGRLNLQSVTEQNNLEEFLATAELAGTEFTAEKLNVKVISKTSSGLPQGEELARITNLHKQHEDLLRIPRRPPWTAEMSASLLDQNEKQAFLEWRRTLAVLQDVEGLVMTPYEKNLDFWRQLWRVIERSDVVVQIVDARNPLLFYCGDLETYVGEVGKDKMCVMLINKADYLDDYQRNMWADYFTKKGIRIAFWSAVNETKRQEAEKAEKEHTIFPETMEDEEDDSSDTDESDEDMEEGDTENTMGNNRIQNEELEIVKCDKELEEETKCNECDKLAEITDVESASDKTVKDIDKEAADAASGGAVEDDGDGGVDDGDGVGGERGINCEQASGDKIVNTGHVYSGPEIVEFLRAIHTGKKVQDGLTTIGMVGYPNVGKSSTINAILKMKKVPVSATPGRTKHFQTLYVDSSLMLCDCPGLVFPSFVTTKADLIVNGILPIDQMRDCIPPTSLICSRVPRSILERTYGIMMPKPGEGEDPNRPPTAYEFLNSYGAMRGFMTARGQPDGPRSSRLILKDYVNGKLLYCHPPPAVEADEFNNFTAMDNNTEAGGVTATATSSQASLPVSSQMDEEFFRKEFSTVHQRTARSGGNDPSSEQQSQKPWKKHNNKNKKEKLRRVYGHRDGQ